MPQIYGIDAKYNINGRNPNFNLESITLDGRRDLLEGNGVVIEVNGVNFGTDFFKYRGGLGYYLKITRIISESVGLKTVFIETPDREVEDKIERKRDISRVITAEKEACQTLNNRLPKALKIDYGWLDDKLDHLLYSVDKSEPDEENYYVAAANHQGLRWMAFTDVNLTNEGNIEFQTPDGSKLQFRPSEVGLIWAKEDTLSSEVAKKYGRLFLNSESLENILSNKALMCHYIDPFLGNLKVERTFYGLGLSRNDRIYRVLSKLNRLVVTKPAGAYQGIGVDILNSDVLAERIGKNLLIDSPHDIIELLVELFIASQYKDIEQYLTMVDMFHPSAPLLSRVTGDYRDSCMRLVVYVPENGKPIFIGGQRRMAPQPYDSNQPLNLRFRSNLSRGAFAEPLTDDEHVIFRTLALDYITKFEEVYRKRERLFAEKIKGRRSPKEFSRYLKDLLWLNMFQQRGVSLNQFLKLVHR